MLTKHKATFQRLSEIEKEFSSGTLVTPDGINTIMLELAGHFTFLNSVKTDLEIEKFDKSISIRENLQREAKTLGTKIVKTQMDQDISYSLCEHVKNIMYLEGQLMNCDKLISVCQSSLKSMERERRMPY